MTNRLKINSCLRIYVLLFGFKTVATNFAGNDGKVGHVESGIFFRMMTFQITGMHDRERRDLSVAFVAYVEHTIADSLESDYAVSDETGRLYLQYSLMFPLLALNLEREDTMHDVRWLLRPHAVAHSSRRSRLHIYRSRNSVYFEIH